jgi:TonB family protein
MNSTVNYLLESGVSLALLSLVYVLFLRKDTFFRLNRIFLLGSVIFSVILPFLKLRVYEPGPYMLSEVTVTPYRNLIEAVTIYGQDFSGSVEHAVLSTDLIIIIYLAGISLFLFRFFIRLFQLRKLIRKNRVEEHGGVKFVFLQNSFTPFSFLGYVFVSVRQLDNEEYDKIIVHESEHVRQGHSFDIILLEILTIFQWFNPAIWMLRRAIRENHEYLADEAVIKTGINSGQYKKLLIKQVIGNQFSLANNFNYSLIKSRIKMLTKIKSPRLSSVKIVVGLFIAVGLLIAFACEQKKVPLNTVEEKSQPLKNNTAKKTELLNIEYDGNTYTIGGSAELLEKLNEVLSSGKYHLGTGDINSGHLYLKADFDENKIPLSEGEIFNSADVMPEFPGGEAELRKFIASEVHYPTEALKKGVQGKVFVTFVVSKDGIIRNSKVVRGVDPELDREALRVVNKLPLWKPGIKAGQLVNVSYTVPISFVLR